MFYEFNQNNSGGSFDFDRLAGISHFVIVEAASADDANDRAQVIGLYFDGCETGQDCDCCGDRWYPVSEYDASAEPMIYGKPVDELDQAWKWINGPEAYVHYRDGGITAHLEGRNTV